MLVDDHQDLCDTLKALLERLPARVEAFCDGESALESLLSVEVQADPYQLVILDMFLPRKVGDPVECLGVRLLRSYNLLSLETPILVFTQYPTYENCVASIKAGAYDYIPKSTAEGSNHGRLLDVCRGLIYPEQDPLTKWIETNFDWLAQQHQDEYVAVLEPPAAAGSRAAFEQIDGKLILTSASSESLKKTMLADPVLRWMEPNIFKIPKEGP